jgi:hypothetical protein
MLCWYLLLCIEEYSLFWCVLKLYALFNNGVSVAVRSLAKSEVNCYSVAITLSATYVYFSVLLIPFPQVVTNVK